MTWRERLFRSLPFVLVILSAVGVAITEEVWAAAVGLVGMWLLPSPVSVSRETTSDVSRETLSVDVSSFQREADTGDTIAVPCVVMHGTAEPHVRGCEGWTFGR